MVEHECDHLDFPIGWVNKENLRKARPDLADQINAFDAGDLEYIARKVGDMLQTDFLIALHVMLAKSLSDEEENTE